ncbi:DUF1501 domain-containing protein [Limnoglobus roseus]|uniref:DUF1501 domain-containing protein n=1 Tax=Limnoglobus roseus TaxID=2598579 RepID=A0A5C1ATQ5_9BACT|nr:DUF1501 domain-containing protein [Limnoglobus roseus]QEL20148.1 hypothetical protein PX52LOC_07236 [Limnoglobus roseus]
MHLPHGIGINRRELLQVGYSGLLGLSLAGVSTAAPVRKPKSVLIVFLTGAASQFETFDPKPDAPAEIRGEFGSIPTKLAGVRFGEYLPKLAARADKFSLVRTFSHKDNNHTAATHHVITGTIQPGVRFDKPISREDWPCYAAGLAYTRPRSDGIPNGVHLPFFLSDGNLHWPGQHAGFLGPRHDPWQLNADPNKRDFQVDNLRMAAGLDVDELNNRQALLSAINQQQSRLAESAEVRKLTDTQDSAFRLLTSGKVAKAFDISQESDAKRDKYGRHMFGQSLLLSRRLLEVGVTVVQANMGRVQNWDQHSNIFDRLKKDLLPPLDQGVSALYDDLAETGQLDDTFVMVIGEFGRTPKLGFQDKAAKIGRDHWAPCFSGLFFGGGVRPGQVIGQSDAIGAYPSTTPFTPEDIGATVYHVLGVPPDAEVRDRVNRPVQLNRGAAISQLFG